MSLRHLHLRALSFDPAGNYPLTADIPASNGRAVYRRSTYDGTWWKHWTTDRPPILIGRNPPKKP